MQAYVLISGINSEMRPSVVEAFLADGFTIDIDRTFSYGICVMHKGHQTIVITDTPSNGGNSNSPEPTAETAIVMIGDGDVSAAVNALLNRADAYMRHPLNYRELVSRVRRLFQRTSAKGIQIEPDWDSQAHHKLLPDGFDDSLSKTESRLLGYLVKRKERLVAHEELMQAVWGERVDKGRLRYYVHSLRKKLIEKSNLELMTHSGLGYYLVDSTPSIN